LIRAIEGLLKQNQRELIVGRKIESGAGGYAFAGLYYLYEFYRYAIMKGLPFRKEYLK